MEDNEGEDRKRKPEDGTGKRNEPPNHSDEEDNEEDAQSSGGEEETIYKEKKRRREKQRRTDLNRALEQLSQVIFMIDPRLKAEAEERLNRNSTNKSRRIEPGAMLSRVELINGASLTLQRLHRENEERKVVIAQLSGGVLAAAGQGNLMHAGGAFGQHNLATRAFPNQLPPGVPPTFSEQDALSRPGFSLPLSNPTSLASLQQALRRDPRLHELLALQMGSAHVREGPVPGGSFGDGRSATDAGAGRRMPSSRGPESPFRQHHTRGDTRLQGPNLGVPFGDRRAAMSDVGAARLTSTTGQASSVPRDTLALLRDLEQGGVPGSGEYYRALLAGRAAAGSGEPTTTVRANPAPSAQLASNSLSDILGRGAAPNPALLRLGETTGSLEMPTERILQAMMGGPGADAAVLQLRRELMRDAEGRSAQRAPPERNANRFGFGPGR